MSPSKHFYPDLSSLPIYRPEKDEYLDELRQIVPYNPCQNRLRHDAETPGWVLLGPPTGRRLPGLWHQPRKGPAAFPGDSNCWQTGRGSPVADSAPTAECPWCTALQQRMWGHTGSTACRLNPTYGLCSRLRLPLNGFMYYWTLSSKYFPSWYFFNIDYYTVEFKGTSRMWTRVVGPKTNSMPVNETHRT